MKLLGTTIEELQPAGGGGVDPEEVVEALEEDGITTGWGLIDKAKEKGMAYEPQGDGIRWVGGA